MQNFTHIFSKKICPYTEVEYIRFREDDNKTSIPKLKRSKYDS